MKQELAMKNLEIYLRDPSTRKLVNEGVASVNDDATSQALSVLRYELETFVCDGQYEKGLEHILYTYLKNVDQAQQPAVWVSGFFGSGKSHLVKMLRALWVDTKFDDGAAARGIAELPTTIQEHLKELTIQAKKHGGVHAAYSHGFWPGRRINLATSAHRFWPANRISFWPVRRINLATQWRVFGHFESLA